MRSVLPLDWEVPEVFRKRLGEAAGRQRMMTADGHLLLVLHQPPTPGIAGRDARVFWRSPTGDWRATGSGDGLTALKKHVAEFAEAVDELEKRWQGASTAEDYYLLLLAVVPLHRTVHHLHGVLQQAREALPEERELINLRDQAGDIDRAAELLHGDAKNGLDFTVAYQSEQQTQRSYDMAVASHRLNLLVATFFPIATLSAIFSMHLTHGLDVSEQPLFFWGLLGFGLLCGLVLSQIVSRAPALPRPKQPASQKTKRAAVRKGR